jgi:hypothetical protein
MDRRAFLAVTAGAIISPLAAATTTKFVVTQAWMDLGAGPMLLSFTGVGGVYAIGDTTPGVNAGFAIRKGDSVALTTTSHVWARATAANISVFTAPISAPVTSSVWSAADAAANGMALSNGGLTVASTQADLWQSIRGTNGKTAGKLYVEFSVDATLTMAAIVFGLGNASLNIADLVGNSPNSGGAYLSYGTAATPAFSLVYNVAAEPAITANATCGMAVDFTAGTVRYSINNVWIDSNNPVLSFVPATVGTLFPTLSMYHYVGGNNGLWTLHASAASQKYLPPPGFQAWDGGPVAPAPKWTVIATATDGRDNTNVVPIDTTGADLLVVYSAASGSSRVITDSYSNTWSAAVDAPAGGLYYCHGGTVGPNHTFSVTPGSYPSTSVAAFSGSATSPLDQVAVGNAVVSAGPITPSVPGALVITATGTNSVIEYPTDFIGLSKENVTGNFGSGIAYQLQTAPTATTATWTNSSPTQTVIASFKPA